MKKKGEYDLLKQNVTILNVIETELIRSKHVLPQEASSKGESFQFCLVVNPPLHLLGDDFIYYISITLFRIDDLPE